MRFQTSGTHSCCRLYYTAKTSNLFSWFEAGFCKEQGYEDQITRIVQAIEDGFQQSLMQHSVLTLFDFSKAYDMVWREKLLFYMLDSGNLSTFIGWIRSFFVDRRAGVQFFNVFSFCRRFIQSLPHGSVLVPLLFMFYINNLTFLLNDDATKDFFSDDVSILTTARKKQDAKAAA